MLILRLIIILYPLIKKYYLISTKSTEYLEVHLEYRKRKVGRETINKNLTRN